MRPQQARPPEAMTSPHDQRLFPMILPHIPIYIHYLPIGARSRRRGACELLPEERRAPNHAHLLGPSSRWVSHRSPAPKPVLVRQTEETPSKRPAHLATRHMHNVGESSAAP